MSRLSPHPFSRHTHPAGRVLRRVCAAALPVVLVSACVDDPTGMQAVPGGPRLGTTSHTSSFVVGDEAPTIVLDMNEAGQITGTTRYVSHSPYSVGFTFDPGVPGSFHELWDFSCIRFGCDPDVPESTATAINSTGSVAGYGPYGVFRWTSGTFQSLDDGYSAVDINDAGVVLAVLSDDGTVLWAPSGTVTPLSGIGWPVALNNAGDALGQTGLWRNGAVFPLGSLGGGGTNPADLNESGQVVGSSRLPGGASSHAFLWSPGGGMQDLGTLGGSNSRATAVNAGGQVAGWSEMASGERHAFRWTSAGGMEDLGTLPYTGEQIDWTEPDPDDRGSEAQDINDAGDVSGFVRTGYYWLPQAFIWTEQGGMQSLGQGMGQFLSNDRTVAGQNMYTSVIGDGDIMWPLGVMIWRNIVIQSRPLADAGGPYAGTEGQPILFDGSATTDPDGDDMTFAWDFDDDGEPDSTGVQVSFTFASPGTYRVRLFATDESNATRIDFATVTVAARRWPSAVVAVPPGEGYSGVEGGRVVFSSTGSASEDGGPLFYRWEFGDGTFAQSRFQTTPFNWSKLYADNGTYTARLIVSDTSRRSDTATVQVVVRNTAPTGSLVILSMVYENTGFAMTVQNATDSSAVDRQAGFTYAFDCGTGSGYGAFAASATANCHAPVDNGTVGVGARVRDKDGGVREYRRTLTVRNVRPYVTGATWAGGVLTIGFSDVGTADAPWRWTVVWGDGTRSTGLVSQQGPAVVQVPHTYPGAGPYGALVHVYDKDRTLGSPLYPVTITP
jgi:probable HAF family extracellular repeat protein